MYTITAHGDHLLIEFQARVTLMTILSALYEVVQRPDYLRMNDIWNFGNASVCLQQEDLGAIVEEIEKIYPPEAQRSKTALVASSGFNHFLASSFQSLADRLPYQIEVFRARHEAERWLV